MMRKNFLFYAANIEPEIARLFKAFDRGQKESAEKFKTRTLRMIDEILTRKEIGAAGREEWFSVRNLVEGYDKLDANTRRILLAFSQPFSHQFMSRTPPKTRAKRFTPAIETF